MIPSVVPCPGGSPWDEARQVVERLRQKGHETWMVGGCVRDLLLGFPVQDVDVTTSAHPDQVEELFTRTVSVGRAFGVIVVVQKNGRHIEVATFRNDGAYIDGRRPETVRFGTVREDVERRDFTVNALLYDAESGKITDHVGGLEDLQAHRLRTVGEPARRFGEDRLRILRGLRFAARLNFTIEPFTWQALCQETLAGLSAERLMQEWEKALLGPWVGDWLSLLADSGHLSALFPPDAAPDHHAQHHLKRAFERLEGSESLAVRQALWLQRCPISSVERWLIGLPGARERQERVRWLLRQETPTSIMTWPLARRRRLLQDTAMGELLAFQRCLSGPEPALAELCVQKDVECQGGPWRKLLCAKDLLGLGCLPGPRLGRLLIRLEDAQLAGAFSTHETGLILARRLLAEDTETEKERGHELFSRR